jgi:hypothetical protein
VVDPATDDLERTLLEAQRKEVLPPALPVR